MFALSSTRTHSLPCATGARPSRSFFGRLRDAAAVARQRRALAHLDDATLKDIGLTREEARLEAQRPMWDAPCNWMR